MHLSRKAVALNGVFVSMKVNLAGTGYLESLQARFEYETETKNKSTRMLQGNNFEFEKYKERYSKESHDCATFPKEEKRTLESE